MSIRRKCMRRYETISIIRPGAGENEIDAIIERTDGIIRDHGGEVIQVDKWGQRKLAYLIKKEQQGYYVYTEYAGTPEAVNEMERIFRIDDTILKYLTVKLQDVYVPDPPKEEDSSEAGQQEDAVAEASEPTEN